MLIRCMGAGKGLIMENNSDMSNANGAKILQQFEEIKFHLELYIDSVAGTEKDVKIEDDPLNRSISNILKSFLVAKIPEYKLIVESNIELFENHEFSEILWNQLSYLRNIIIRDSNNKLLNIFENIKDFISKFENIRISIIILKDKNNLKSEIKKIDKFIDDFEIINLSLKEQEDLFVEYNEKINILIFIESYFYSLKNKLDESLYEEGIIIKNENYKKYLKEILPILKEGGKYKDLLFVDLGEIKEIKIKISNFSIDDLNKSNELVEIFTDFKELIRKKSSIFDDDLYEETNSYLRALKIYELERDSLYQRIEISSLKSKIDSISFVDESITNKNEFYNKKIESLLKIEKGFLSVLDYYNKLSQNDFTGKEWSQILKTRSNVDYIVNIFKNKDVYKFFLLLDESYIDSLMNYLNFKIVDDKSIQWEEEVSQQIIADFHEKTVKPDSFIKLRHEEWNTPLFWFNTNHYYLIKDYESKISELNSYIKKIKDSLQEKDEDFKIFLKDSSKRVKDQLNYNFESIVKTMRDNIEKNDFEIGENGALNLKVKDYISSLEGYNNKYYTQVTNILSSNQVVKEVVDSIRGSKSFVDEVEGLYINNETRKVYKTVYDEEIKIANNFRLAALCIYGFLGFVAFISLLILLFEPSNSTLIVRLTHVDTLLIKISLILTLAFIGIYLSREGEKHRRIANQARQTMNELHAFSSYSSDIKDKVPEIKTKLADKYFGKTLYETEKAMTPDSDVLKSVIDQAKATTDLVKAIKGSMIQNSSSSESDKNKSD